MPYKVTGTGYQKDHGFEATELVIYTDAAPFTRRLYIMSDEVVAWDGAPSKLALFSDSLGVYSPVRLRVTGHRVRSSRKVSGLVVTGRITHFDEGIPQPAELCEIIVSRYNGINDLKITDIDDVKVILG